MRKALSKYEKILHYYNEWTDNAAAYTLSLNAGAGIFYGGYLTGSIGFAFDKYDNYALMCSAAGFISGLMAISGSSDPESGNNIFLGANASFGIAGVFTGFQHVYEFKGLVKNFKLDVPLTPLDLTYSYDDFDEHFKAFSIGFSDGGFGRFSNEEEVTSVFAFTDKDVYYWSKVLKRVKETYHQLKSTGKIAEWKIYYKEEDGFLYVYILLWRTHDQTNFKLLNGQEDMTNHIERFQIEKYQLLKIKHDEDYYYRTNSVTTPEE